MKHRAAQVDPSGAGLYVHVPFCQQKCYYCGFYSVPLGTYNPESLVDTLLAELACFGPINFRTVYIGGGSPTCLPQELLYKLISGIRSLCEQTEEFTLECNPGQTSFRLLETLYEMGVNRLSFGIQSFVPKELTLLGRLHTVPQALTAITNARKAGFENIGVDLIFAIPGSNIRTWQYNLDKIVNLEPQHVSTYSLSYESGTALDKARLNKTLIPVNEDLDRTMYEMTIDSLENAGYQHYEISNFAKPGFTCRHNLGYWHNHSFLGIGPDAASYWQGMRRRNMARIDDYIDHIRLGEQPWIEKATPSKNDRLCETAVLNLRLRTGIEPHTFSSLTGMNPWQVFGPRIRHHQKQGMLQIKNQRICLTRRALPIADRVLCDFAAL